MNDKITYIPIIVGTGQEQVLLRAATAAYKNVLLVCPLVMRRIYEEAFKRLAPDVPFPQCVTAAYVARHGVPNGADLVLIDEEHPANPASKFWRALTDSRVQIWVTKFGGCV